MIKPLSSKALLRCLPRWILRGSALILALAWLSSCGYSLRTSHSAVLEKEGIRRIYVSPIVNNSYQSGVENLVYNALLKNLAGNQWIILVPNPGDADAVLSGSVTQARYWAPPGAQVLGSALPRSPGTGGDFSKMMIAIEYMSELSCTFSLVRRNPPPGKLATVWAASFTRNRPFPAANSLGALGTTSSLINESEFDRSLSEMARDMMADVRESIYNRF